MSGMLTCYRGCVNTWECDEMGHMNVRFYVTKAEEGLGVFAAALGLTPDWLVSANCELVIVDQHIRYLREMTGGDDLHINAGLLEVTAKGFQLYQEVRPSSADHIAASIISQVELCKRTTGQSVKLPRESRKHAAPFQRELPEAARPRSIPLSDPIPGGTLGRAEELGMTPISVGQVMSGDVDSQGRLRTESYLGRVSDGIGSFMGSLRQGVAEADGGDPNRQIGGAALEYRLIYHKRPEAGDVVVVYAGLLAVSDKVFHVCHWTVDAASGEPLCSSQAVAISLDLKARKAISIPASYRAVYESRVIQGLGEESV